jgi:hypothetical protein
MPVGDLRVTEQPECVAVHLIERAKELHDVAVKATAAYNNGGIPRNRIDGHGPALAVRVRYGYLAFCRQATTIG